MPFRPPFRSLALPFAAGLLVLGLACKGKKHDSTGSTASTQVTLSGKVLFDRIPVTRDVNGLPTGLESNSANFQTNLPARYVKVRLYQEVDVVENGVTSVFYRVPTSVAGEVFTLGDGSYSFQVDPGTKYMIEVQAAMTVGAGSSFVTLTADPAGLSSTVPVMNRLRYCYRQDLAGTKPPVAPGVNHVAFSAIQADTTANIHIGVSEPWFLADTDVLQNDNLPVTRVVPTYSPASPTYAFAGQAETVASGSKILGILDSLVGFSYSEGIAGNYFTLLGSGNYLDLNYIPGQADPKGTWINFDRNSYPKVPGPTQQNVAYDPELGVTRFLGTVSGSPDMGWDDGVLLTLAARCSIYSQFLGSAYFADGGPAATVRRLTPVGEALPDLHPNLALIDGLPELMAALAQKNPYLGLAAKDVRDISGLTPAQKTIYSAPLIRALGWEAALLEHGITSPGTPTDWAKLKINNMRAFFTIAAPGAATNTQNLLLQLNALATAGTTSAGATPSSIFTTTAVQNLLASAPLSVPVGNVPWPLPASGPFASLVAEWGTNPSGALPDLSLSMANAVQVSGAFPNLSHEELQFGHLTQTGAKQYKLAVALFDGITPITLTGGQVELTFISPSSPSGTQVQTLLFDASTPAPLDLLLEGRAGIDSGHFVRLRMLSPNTVQPDVTVRITLTPQN